MSIGDNVNKFNKLILVVFSSDYFFPVSCIISLFIVTMLFSVLDTRLIAKGDKPHPSFYVIQKLSDHGESIFKAIPFEDLPSKFDSTQFLLTQPTGRAFLERGKASFTVQCSENNKNIVEVRFRGDEASGVSKYSLSNDGIIPIYSKVFHRVHLFAAIPYAAAIALAIMFGARAKLERNDNQ